VGGDAVEDAVEAVVERPVRPGGVGGSRGRSPSSPCSLVVSVPPYLSLDRSLSRVPAPDGFAAHFPLLVAHVCFGTVAMLTAIPQIWPWFRRRHPGAHRVVGRVYVFGGVVPAALTALPIGALSPFGPVARVSNVLLAAVWLSCTITGVRMARRRRHREHRRWTVRSVVLTMSIITNRLWAVAALGLLVPPLDTTFHGDAMLLSWTAAGISTWAGWVVPLLAVQYHLDRRGTPAHRTPHEAPRVPRHRGPARDAGR
jgi:uncharacterized membrane protein